MSEHIGWRISAYALERLLPAEGSTLTSTAIWEDYKRWCAAGEMLPLAQTIFLGDFADLARQAGIPHAYAQGNLSFWDVALKPERADVES